MARSRSTASLARAPRSCSDAGAGRMSIKVYLVDDHRLFLAGVKAELEEEFDIVGIGL